MNVNNNSQFDPNAFNSRRNQGPPNPDQMAEKIASRVASGDLSTEQVSQRLENRFGDNASSAIKEDGSIDVDALSSLFASGPAEGSRGGGGARVGQHPAADSSTRSAENLMTQLSEIFGEEEAEAVFYEDGSVNFEALINLVKSTSITGEESIESGLLLDESS